MNHVTLIGRLVADPDHRITPTGTYVARYRLAVDRPFSKDGKREADFISCVAFGKGAEFAGNHLHKGTKIAIEGRIQTGSYEKEDGSKVYTTDVIVDRHEFCESRNAASAPTAASSEPVFDSGFSLPDDPEDLPF
jgi:single-strand DNA-binding protein